MTIDASLENIAIEIERRWSTIKSQRQSINDARIIIIRNTAYKTMMCANIVKTLSGVRISPINISVKTIAKHIQYAEMNKWIAINRAMTDQVYSLTVIAESMKMARKVTKMVNAYIAESENDLHKLYLLERRSRLTSH